ncbi:PPR domain-containing protein/PPR_2 domain-containing protein/PPR_3 domain-containing protein [Cephalotus follicularis]|uniref:PPR domain-containing protein/PPR_2 domain-containing protein/PPR_3 domain-containing protein n=1 Tax=Cephalotus follicularis TaxID=3775 RepID=A0A1Q3BKU0_CEPFO|nr:PPR domain-containing protein/PPR_2 domain-containing protein/PPR_3 domain-containing protein [Cephalotus follicularis]
MYNSMIRGYMQTKLPKQSVLCYLHMLYYGLEANNYTFPPLIKACTILVPCESRLIGRLVHAHLVIFGFGDDPFVISALIEFYSLIHDMGTARKVFESSLNRDMVMWTAMVDGYGKMGDVTNARELFEKMPERNVISWSAIMAAYSRVSDFKEVLCLFRRMQEVGTTPNESVLVSVITACAHFVAIAQGIWVHSYAKRYNVESNPVLATALVDMYSKSGYIESALSVFEGIANKDAGAWNAMISGVAMNGDARKSLQLFDEMVKNGTQPTERTFVAVLTACTHARMVKEGLKLFEQMNSSYGVNPRLEHYACVVDLLGRSGKVEEAETFIEEKMGGVGGGDANVWGALLGSCRIYGNVEVGNRVWKKLTDMGVADCGTHILSYNIYKEAGWDVEAMRVRNKVTVGGMKKKPGCSVIEVDGVVEEFLASGFGHPQTQEIHKTLDSFSKMMNLDKHQHGIYVIPVVE